MSIPPDDYPTVRPIDSTRRPPPPRSGGGVWRVLFVLVLLGSLGMNVLVCCGAIFGGLAGGSDGSGIPILEKYVSGTQAAANKVAVVKIEGTIVEGLIGYAFKQIEQAASDENVKAVVVRIESPGGTITASDDLHRRLTHLRDGTTPKFQGKSAKPLVVSMGAVAASGGYYIAMPAIDANDLKAKKLFAERSTITGSIGVYASLPNVSELANKHGVKMEMIKAGDIKGSGSLFHELTPQERQPWQDMVSHAYKQFIDVCEAGRPGLKGQFEKELFPEREVKLFDDKGNPKVDGENKPMTAKYTRKLADGGIFTADEAKDYGLIDAIGTVEDAAAEAAKQAGLGPYKVVQYDKPITLASLLTGTAKTPDWQRAVAALGPRVWAIVPQAQLGATVELFGR